MSRICLKKKIMGSVRALWVWVGVCVLFLAVSWLERAGCRSDLRRAGLSLWARWAGQRADSGLIEDASVVVSGAIVAGWWSVVPWGLFLTAVLLLGQLDRRDDVLL